MLDSEYAVLIQANQKFTAVIKFTKPVKPHGIQALEDVPILAMLRRSAMLFEEPNDVFEPCNDALLAWRVGARLGRLDLDSKFSKQFVI